MRKIRCPSFFKYTNFYIGTLCSHVAFFPWHCHTGLSHTEQFGVFTARLTWNALAQVAGAVLLWELPTTNTTATACLFLTSSYSGCCFYTALQPALQMSLQELLIVRLQLPTVREKIRSVNELPKIQYKKTVVLLKSRPLHASKTDL